MQAIYCAHLWRAYNAKGDQQYYYRAPCTTQALVAALRFVQWHFTCHFTIRSDVHSLLPLAKQLVL